MSLLIVFCLLLGLPNALANEGDVFVPTRISYKQLLELDTAPMLVEALSTVGMVSIGDIPDFDSKRVLSALPSCSSESLRATKLVFEDGTTRKTIATHSTGIGRSSFLENGHTEACIAFDDAALPFRETVSDVALALASLLDDGSTILSNAERDFTFKDIFTFGEHLEHFHTYESQRKTDPQETVKWHTDQGLALIFTPGQRSGFPVDGFYIKLQDGSEKKVHFDERDELVLLLGDGVHQYINSHREAPLRALPHALKLDMAQDPRVWYGLMVLPPLDAVHPVHQVTFETLRSHVMSLEEDKYSFACSSASQTRSLQESTCEATQYYCWHQCYDLTASNNAASCKAKGLELACINDNGDVWDGVTHGFYPGCINKACGLSCLLNSLIVRIIAAILASFGA